MTKPLTILILAANIVLHAAAPAQVKLVRTPYFQFAPGYALLSARIEPDARNRAYCLFYNGGMSGSQCRDLAGADAAATQRELTLKGLGAGHYSAQVKVERNDGSVIASNVVEWDVLEPGEERP